jgi:hypothetical protein
LGNLILILAANGGVPLAISLLMPGWRSLLVWTVGAILTLVLLWWLVFPPLLQDERGAIPLVLSLIFIFGLFIGSGGKALWLVLAEARRQGLIGP